MTSIKGGEKNDFSLDFKSLSSKDRDGIKLTAQCASFPKLDPRLASADNTEREETGWEGDTNLTPEEKTVEEQQIYADFQDV